MKPCGTGTDEPGTASILKMDVVLLEGPFKIQDEEDRFRLLIKAANFPHQVEIIKHLTDATDLYTKPGKEHSCQNECRSFFFQALIDDISEETNRLVDIKHSFLVL
jgi:hypothetical protein